MNRMVIMQVVALMVGFTTVATTSCRSATVLKKMLSLGGLGIEPRRKESELMANTRDICSTVPVTTQGRFKGIRFKWIRPISENVIAKIRSGATRDIRHLAVQGRIDHNWFTRYIVSPILPYARGLYHAVVGAIHNINHRRPKDVHLWV